MSATSLDGLTARATALCSDPSLPSVLEWKRCEDGLAIGFMPVYVPRELLHAHGALPVGVLGWGADLEIIRGDAYYQSYICHIPRSTIELGLNGSLDCLDGMIFPATCDVIRNLSGMWQMLFPDKLVRYLDVPQNFDPEMGGEFFRRELQELSDELVRRGCIELSEAALRESIEVYNRNRRLVQQLYELRREKPWKTPTHELYLFLRAGMVIPVEEHNELLDGYLDAVLCESDRKPMDQARVVLTGSFCEQPPLGLIKTLERSGCYIVDDDFIQIHRWIRSDIPVEGDPLQNLVNAFLEDSIASPIRYIDQDVKGKELCDRICDCDAEGVLFCAPSFCDPALLDQPMVVTAVEKEGIPWTSFKYAENSGQFQVVREQAGTFADSIKLWSGR